MPPKVKWKHPGGRYTCGACGFRTKLYKRNMEALRTAVGKHILACKSWAAFKESNSREADTAECYARVHKSQLERVKCS